MGRVHFLHNVLLTKQIVRQLRSKQFTDALLVVAQPLVLSVSGVQRHLSATASARPAKKSGICGMGLGLTAKFTTAILATRSREVSHVTVVPVSVARTRKCGANTTHLAHQRALASFRGRRPRHKHRRFQYCVAPFSCTEITTSAPLIGGTHNASTIPRMEGSGAPLRPARSLLN